MSSVISFVKCKDIKKDSKFGIIPGLEINNFESIVRIHHQQQQCKVVVWCLEEGRGPERGEV